MQDRLTILITTDHGMTPFFGESCLADIVQCLNQAGIATGLPGERTENTRVVALSYTIELSLYCAPDITEAEKEIIEKVCGQALYIDRYFGRAEMQREYGFDPRGPEFLLSPKYGMHFYYRDIAEDTFAASHDSFHETSQHIFGVMLGGGVDQNTTCEKKTAVIDLLPRIVKEKFGFILNPKRQGIIEELS